MKRLIIDGDWQESGNAWTLVTPDGLLAAEVNAARCKVTAEDHPDPLPTEPGTRFWGATPTTDPQWWFVRGIDNDSISYVPARGHWLIDDEAESHGLTRLPDTAARS